VVREQYKNSLKLASIIFVAAACRTAYLPVSTLSRATPSCGAPPIAAAARSGLPTYFACQVDELMSPPKDRPLSYPELMSGSNVEGAVQLQFVVDERGSVDSTTLVVLTSTHDIFTRAARESLRSWGARPARRRGTPVRQITRHAFCFRLILDGKLGDCPKELATYSPSQISVVCEELRGQVRASDHPAVGLEIRPPRRPPSRCTR